MSLKPNQIGGLDDKGIAELPESPEYTGQMKPRESSSMH